MYKGVSALVAALASTMSALATITPSLAASVSVFDKGTQHAIACNTRKANLHPQKSEPRTELASSPASHLWFSVSLRKAAAAAFWRPGRQRSTVFLPFFFQASALSSKRC